MADITTKEIKGISARNLIWLLSSVIMIEFTILMSYNSLTSTAKENKDRINQFEFRQNILIDKVNDLNTRMSIMESDKKMNQK